MKKTFESSFEIFESKYSHLRSKNKKALSSICKNSEHLNNIIIYGPKTLVNIFLHWIYYESSVIKI